MAGMRWPPEDSEPPQGGRLQAASTAADMFSDDDRSIAADSWSIKSEYGSTLDDEQRHADAAEALSAVAFRASDYSSDKDDQYNEVEESVLGLQSHWDATYADELANFHEHGHVGEIWFGAEVMDTVAVWTARVCLSHRQPHNIDQADFANLELEEESSDAVAKELTSFNVLDIGTGNGLLLQALAKQGFSDLTGTDYSEAAVELARNLAVRDGFANINFVVDDILETKLERQFKLVMDKGTLDAIGLHPNGAVKRIMYWGSVSKLVAPGGLLVITSCNSTKDELVEEINNYQHSLSDTNSNSKEVLGCSPSVSSNSSSQLLFCCLDHIRTYPTFTFAGIEGTRVATVAFLRSV
uniref:Protein-lysine N-methyltransferase n=1 Tax=Wollemia nobilis TaxID=56998 RepID=A0A0C9S3N8_9CONI